MVEKAQPPLLPTPFLSTEDTRAGAQQKEAGEREERGRGVHDVEKPSGGHSVQLKSSSCSPTYEHRWDK